MTIITETEARTKWCPYSPTKSASCCASGCMMWRSVPQQYEYCRTEYGQLPRDYHTSTPQWQQIDKYQEYGLHWSRMVSEAGGYCGLAGKP